MAGTVLTMEPESWAMEPFGLLVETQGSFFDLDLELIRRWITTHKVVVIRGLKLLHKTQLPLAARRLGPLQAGEQGSVTELKLDDTGRGPPERGEVLKTQRTPRWLVYQCLRAPEPRTGGETLFVYTRTRNGHGHDEVLTHCWQDGDLLIADNHALLHGHAAFRELQPRHLLLVKVLDAERSPWQGVWDSLTIRRPDRIVSSIPVLLLPALWLGVEPAVFSSATWGLLVLCFFLLHQFTAMVECFADRELSLVYKTRTAEAVLGLGESNMLAQIGLTMVTTLMLVSMLAGLSIRLWLMSLVLTWLVVAHQYAMAPLHLKSRGLWQAPTLWLLVFFAPMLLVHGTLGGLPGLRVLGMMILYGTMQLGILLVRAAKDHDEDLEAHLHTSAVALGPLGTIAVALTLVAVGAIGLLVLQIIDLGAGQWTWFAAGMMCASVIWVLAEMFALALALRESDDLGLVKSYATRIPLWNTALGWSTLAVGVLRWAQ